MCIVHNMKVQENILPMEVVIHVNNLFTFSVMCGEPAFAHNTTNLDTFTGISKSELKLNI